MEDDEDTEDDIDLPQVVEESTEEEYDLGDIAKVISIKDFLKLANSKRVHLYYMLSGVSISDYRNSGLAKYFKDGVDLPLTEGNSIELIKEFKLGATKTTVVSTNHAQLKQILEIGFWTVPLIIGQTDVSSELDMITENKIMLIK